MAALMLCGRPTSGRQRAPTLDVDPLMTDGVSDVWAEASGPATPPGTPRAPSGPTGTATGTDREVAPRPEPSARTPRQRPRDQARSAGGGLSRSATDQASHVPAAERHRHQP